MNKDQITSEGIATRADIVCMYLRGRVIYEDELRRWLLSLFGRVEFGEHLRDEETDLLPLFALHHVVVRMIQLRKLVSGSCSMCTRTVIDIRA